MAERTARLGTIFYKDADGRYRRAYAGDTIKVHPDYLERFDRLNVLPGDEKETEKAESRPEPKQTAKRPAARKAVNK